MVKSILIDSGLFAYTLPCWQAKVFADILMSSIVFQLLQNLISQVTAGYAVSVLLACGTQMCSAITEAVTHLVGLSYSPLTFSWPAYANQPTFMHLCITNPTTLQTSIHWGEAFKASRHHLVSAMKSDNEQSELPTATHQNGFSSTMTIGVPTFISRFIHLFIHLECSRYMFTANTCGKHEESTVDRVFLKPHPTMLYSM